MTEVWRARVLDELEGSRTELVESLADLVRRPSVSGSDEENALQHQLRGVLDQADLETDLWAIDLAELTAEDGFPGMEVERSEAWGLVGRLPGREPDAPSLMFNAHLDVVPAGGLDRWAGGEAYSARISKDVLYGRGACDMKGGFVAACSLSALCGG